MRPRVQALPHIGLLAALALLLGACTKQSAAPPALPTSGMPDWSGVWLADGVESNIDGYTLVDPAMRAAPPPPLLVFSPLTPWNEAGRARVQALGSNPGNRADNAAGWGFPLMMIGQAPLQFFITPAATVIVSLYRDMRQIHTDGRGHQPAEEAWPATTWGDSIGHWDGDTLVIDTIGVRNPQLFFGISAPFSESAHYVERLRLTGPDRIEGEMTIEDPVTLTRPVQVKLAFVRTREVERMVFDSFSNDRSKFDGEFNTIEAPGK